jgi:hypothetical protein
VILRISPPSERPQSMNVTALRSKQFARQDVFDAPDDDLIPLRYSVAIWLVLAAGSWAVVIYAASLIF